jgi:hypothetical protein
LKKKKKNIIVGYKIDDLIMGISTLVFSIFMLIKMDSSESLGAWIIISFLAIASIMTLWKFVNPRNKFVKKNSKEAEKIRVSELKKFANSLKVRDYNKVGFKTIISGNISEVKWTDIKRVNLKRTEIFKKDEFYLDILVDKGSANSFEISETSGDWDKFIEKIMDQFPQIDRDWKTNHLNLPSNQIGSTLYERIKNVG